MLFGQYSGTNLFHKGKFVGRPAPFAESPLPAFVEKRAKKFLKDQISDLPRSGVKAALLASGVPPVVAGVITPYATRAVKNFLNSVSTPRRKSKKMARFSSRRYGRRSRRATFRSNRRFKRAPAGRATMITPVPRKEIKQVVLHQSASGLATIHQQELGLVSEGSSKDQRVSKVIRSVDLDVRGIISLPTGQTPINPLVRIVVYRWDQGYVSPAPGSIFDTDAAPAVDGQYFQDNIKNYHVMYDKTFSVQPVQFDTSTPFNNIGTTQFPFHIHRRLSKLITFLDEDTDAGDSRYFFEVIGEDATAVNVEYTWGYKFIDM